MYKPTTVLCSLLLLFVCHVHGQRRHIENVEEVVTEELNFAKMAGDTSIRCAFLHYLDSNGIVFRSGRPVNGIAVYSEVPPTARDVLTWRPVVAHAASSGELGFTSGPYTYRAERNKEVVARGYYFTVWKKTASGEYKVLLDGGVSTGPADLPESLTLNELRNFTQKKPARDTLGFMKAESEFTRNAALRVVKAYQHSLGDSCWMLRAGQPAITSKPSGIAMLQQQGSNSYKFTLIGGGVSKTNDLGYAYGLAEVVTPKSGEKKTGFFIRVWQHAGTEWKIIADVLNLQ